MDDDDKPGWPVSDHRWFLTNPKVWQWACLFTLMIVVGIGFVLGMIEFVDYVQTHPIMGPIDYNQYVDR